MVYVITMKNCIKNNINFNKIHDSTFASIANALLAWNKKELSGVNSATLHGVKRTFDCLRMRFKRKSIVLSEAVTPFYFTKLTSVYYLRNFST